MDLLLLRERERERESFIRNNLHNGVVSGAALGGGGGGGGVYSYSADTIEGPRAPAVKLTARHSSLTRVRADPLSPW